MRRAAPPNGKQANLDALLDHPATPWIAGPALGAVGGAAIHPLVLALHRAMQSKQQREYERRHGGGPGLAALWFDHTKAVSPIGDDEARRLPPTHPFSLVQ